GDWTSQSFGREWASGALMLGGLKFLGGLTQRGMVRWVGGTSALERFSRLVAPELGQFSGILLGNRMQAWAGLRKAPGFDAEMADALATLVHFHVGGQLSRTAFGPGLAVMEGKIELQAEQLGQPRPPKVFPTNSGNWSWATLGPRSGGPAVRIDQPQKEFQ